MLEKYIIFLKICLAAFFISLFTQFNASAQAILFDFDNAPLYTSLPIYQTSGGITARLSAAGQGYSVQNANVLGFTPSGFAGRIIYPNSIYLADLLVRFNQTITVFSIMYCCQELGCDDAATMRVTAFKNGVYVGTNTRTATFPGTWPVDTLRCSFPQGFDSVVVHYASPPPTCQDYGVIYMADNMRVTPLAVNVQPESEITDMFILNQNYPNPFNPTTNIKFNIPKNSFVSLKVFDLLGKEIDVLINEECNAGSYNVDWNASDYPSGVYLYKLEANGFSETRRMLLVK